MVNLAKSLDKIHIIANREVAKAARPVVHLPRAENSLVAEGEPEETCPEVGPKSNPCEPGRSRLVGEVKATRVRTTGDSLRDHLGCPGRGARIGVQKEKNVSPRGTSRGIEAKSSRPAGQIENPGADRLERGNRFRGNSGARHDNLHLPGKWDKLFHNCRSFAPEGKNQRNHSNRY